MLNAESGEQKRFDSAFSIQHSAFLPRGGFFGLTGDLDPVRRSRGR